MTFDWGSRPRTTLAFDSDAVTSDAGLSVLRDLDGRLGITAKAAACFNDLRRDSMTVHPVERLVRETVYAYAAGYADANDHAPLSRDTFFTHLLGPVRPDSSNPKSHEGLASEATISRLLNARKLQTSGFDVLHVRHFVDTVKSDPPDVITLDIDGYPAETFGQQQLSLFNGHYFKEMYYPLVVTAAEYGMILAGQLRPGNVWPAHGGVELLRPVLEYLREHLPHTRIRLRADGGFIDPDLYLLLEEFRVEYAIRMRLSSLLKREFDTRLGTTTARALERRPDEHWEFFAELTHRSKTWPVARRHILKVQYDPHEAGVQRYVIITNSRRSARRVWRFYNGRGQCEQRIDELKNQLSGDRFSCCTFAANDLKLQLMLVAHNLIAALRVLLPAPHELKRATIDRLRITLVKCGASIRTTVRRVWLHASRTWPFKHLLLDVARCISSHRLRPAPVWRST
jgi:hypothetical protein